MNSQPPLILDALVGRLHDWCQQEAIRLCVCFGSQATGRARVDSDVDLAIWPEGEVDLPTRLRWIRSLEELVGRPVSLVVITPNLNPVLGFEIVRDGRLVYERRADEWMRQRGQLWHAYNDSLPFRRAARQLLKALPEELADGA